jgi:hypothetical protein
MLDMEHVQLEPVIIEDLVKYGEDIGFDRGFGQGIDQGISQGISQGIDRGAAQERVRVYHDFFQDRLGRPLTPNEHDTLARRITALTTKRLREVIFASSPAALEAWIADPNAK